MAPQTDNNNPEPKLPDSYPPAPSAPADIPVPFTPVPKEFSSPDESAAPDSLQSSISTPQPLSFPAPVGLTAPFKPKHSRKKIVAIVVSIIVVLMGLGGYAAYALWYNAPGNVVGDALGQLMKAKSGTANGTLVSSNSDNANVKVDFAFAQAESRDSSITTSLDFTSDKTTYNVKASAVLANDEKIYFKMDNLQTVLNVVLTKLQGESSPWLDVVNGFVEKIDGKWIVVTPDDLQSDGEPDKRAECADKAFQTFRDDSNQQSEITKVYKKNMFIVVSKNLGSEKINGTTSNHYELKFDEKKARSFTEAAMQTTLFKAIDKCYEGEISKSYNANKTDNDSAASTPDNTKVELWIDKWNHKPTKLKVLDTSNTKNTFQSTFNLGAKPSVTVPKADTTYDDLKTEIESIQQEIFGGLSTGEEFEEMEQPVLGAQTFLPSYMTRLLQ